MKKSSFDFLRATYFRWAGQIEHLCGDLSGAPAVLSIGDTHLENFGTWRDTEGRLVWGVNDFDEAAEMAYPFDLVRLATSVRLSSEHAASNAEAAEAILGGYRAGLVAPRPTLLDEQETWMRPFVACTDDDRKEFWREVDGFPDATPPASVAADLERSIPELATLLRFASRAKGGGSLGRPRYVAIANWRGGQVVREAKALVPSAWTWAHGDATGAIRFLELANGKHRSPDPFLLLLGHSMASDIVVRFAEATPDVAATVAVSMFSPAVTATAPRNLLVIVGGWEGMLQREALRAVGLATAPEPAAPGVTYGRFADGTPAHRLQPARRACRRALQPRQHAGGAGMG